VGVLGSLCHPHPLLYSSSIKRTKEEEGSIAYAASRPPTFPGILST
jgi:hypothetical protein